MERLEACVCKRRTEDQCENMEAVEFGQENRQTVILLHGGGLSWWNYREAAAILAKDCHVVIPILDGHGEAPFDTMEVCAARLIDWIDRRFGGQVWAIGGLSLGGQLLVEMLSQRPEICRYALLESVLVKPMPLTHALIGPSVAMSHGLIRQRWFARLQFAWLRIPEALFEDYYRDTCKITKADMTAFLRANSGYRLKPEFAGNRARALIAAGSREQRNILDSARLLHGAIPGSRLEILPGLFHGELSMKYPEKYAELLTGLWEGQHDL